MCVCLCVCTFCVCIYGCVHVCAHTHTCVCLCVCEIVNIREEEAINFEEKDMKRVGDRRLERIWMEEIKPGKQCNSL